MAKGQKMSCVTSSVNMYNLSRSERTKNLHICILHQHILGVFNA